MSRGFVTPLRVEALDAVRWKLLEDFVWIGSQQNVFTVPAGAVTDFATVPWWTQSLLPKTGTWTRAAVLHDKMCDDLNRYHRSPLGWRIEYDAWNTGNFKPVFDSVDTDAIFRKNARECGTGPIRSELLWLGVRYGALVNPARRGQWLSTAPRVLADTLAVLVTLIALVAFVGWAWPW